MTVIPRIRIVTDDELQAEVDALVAEWRALHDTSRSANSGSVKTSDGVSSVARTAA